MTETATRTQACAGAKCGSTRKFYGGLSCEVAAVQLLPILYSRTSFFRGLPIIKK